MALSTVGLLGPLGAADDLHPRQHDVAQLRRGDRHRAAAARGGRRPRPTRACRRSPIRRRARSAAAAPTEPSRGGTPNLSPTQDTASTQAIYASLHHRRRQRVTNTTVITVTVYWSDNDADLHQVDAGDAEEPVRNARLHAHRAHDLDGAVRPHRRRRDVAGHRRRARAVALVARRRRAELAAHRHRLHHARRADGVGGRVVGIDHAAERSRASTPSTSRRGTADADSPATCSTSISSTGRSPRRPRGAVAAGDHHDRAAVTSSTHQQLPAAAPTIRPVRADLRSEERGRRAVVDLDCDQHRRHRAAGERQPALRGQPAYILPSRHVVYSRVEHRTSRVANTNLRTRRC